MSKTTLTIEDLILENIQLVSSSCDLIKPPSRAQGAITVNSVFDIEGDVKKEKEIDQFTFLFSMNVVGYKKIDPKEFTTENEVFKASCKYRGYYRISKKVSESNLQPLYPKIASQFSIYAKDFIETLMQKMNLMGSVVPIQTFQEVTKAPVKGKKKAKKATA